MNMDIRVNTEGWRKGEEAEIFDLETRRDAVSVDSMRTDDGGVSRTLGEVLGNGGILLDYGCGKGGIGTFLARKHSKLLLQADKYDDRGSDFKSLAPMLIVGKDEPPKFENTEWRLLEGTVDTVLLKDVLSHVQSDQLDLIRNLASFISSKGKICVVSVSGASTGFMDSEAGKKLRTAISADEFLSEKVLFFQ